MSRRVTSGVPSMDPIPSATIVEPRAPGKLACDRFNVSVTECKRIETSPGYHRIDLYLTITGGGHKYIVSTPHENVRFHGAQLIERNETRFIHLESVSSALPAVIYLQIQAVGDFLCQPRTIQLPC